MGQTLTLKASDGHELSAYRADPAGAAKGGIVVIQEIFGVNHHIRSVCDRLAAAGYTAIAPALFDRFQRGFESGYSADEIAHARSFLTDIDWAAMLRDTDAALAVLRKEGPAGIVGFCMGGTVSFLGATRLDGLSAAVCYYGGAIVKFADEKPRCPTQMHFGERDAHIPMSDVETIRAKRPDCEIHVYAADHGFHCDERGSYDAPSSKVAWERTLAWFGRHLGKAQRSAA
jgi:carboxymethylenebutenolidase